MNRLLLIGAFVNLVVGLSTERASAQSRGAMPVSAWECPASHPVKGNFTTYSAERCIFHVPGGRFYQKTKPERCYKTAHEAVADGCRQSLK
jgi:hypothetical protein